tara:strand:+ start:617 stop:1150 length:534 start_codon:yes stop_codon:yes gene_type:complete
MEKVFPGKVINAHMSYVEVTSVGEVTKDDERMEIEEMEEGGGGGEGEIKNGQEVIEERHDEDMTKSIVFLYKVKSKQAGSSYGLHVARLAGVPTSLIQNAGRQARKMKAGIALEDMPIRDGGRGEKRNGQKEGVMKDFMSVMKEWERKSAEGNRDRAEETQSTLMEIVQRSQDTLSS